MEECRVIQVIESNILKRGNGTSNSPIRIIKQYWSLDGSLLAEVDPLMNNIRYEEVNKLLNNNV